jgi:hypothetical protein
MKAKLKTNTVLIKRNLVPLSFIKGTPVLPALSKRNVDEIIELLEELDEESRFYDEDNSESE